MALGGAAEAEPACARGSGVGDGVTQDQTKKKRKRKKGDLEQVSGGARISKPQIKITKNDAATPEQLEHVVEELFVK